MGHVGHTDLSVGRPYSQALIAELFDNDVPTIIEHLQNIFEEGELDPEATIRKFRIARSEGSRQLGRLIEHYSLDAYRFATRRVANQVPLSILRTFDTRRLPNLMPKKNLRLDMGGTPIDAVE